MNGWMGWVEAMTGVPGMKWRTCASSANLLSRGGRLDRFHKNPYANALREFVRKAAPLELVDRLLVAALIEVRSCERFSVLAATAADMSPRDSTGRSTCLNSDITGYFCVLPGIYPPQNWIAAGRRCWPPKPRFSRAGARSAYPFRSTRVGPLTSP